MFVNLDTAINLFSQELVQGFDQEAAAVVMARLASYKMEMEVSSLDYHLFCTKFYSNQRVTAYM